MKYESHIPYGSKDKVKVKVFEKYVKVQGHGH